MTIVEVEDILVGKVKDWLPGKLRQVDSLPGNWDADMLRRFILTAPAVYVSWLGGRPQKEGQETLALESTWELYALTNHASGQAARRRGDSTQIGAYEILQFLAPRFNGLTIDGVGTLWVRGVENLYSGALDSKGAALYALTLGLPLVMDIPDDDSSIDLFETLHVDFDLAPKDGTVEGHIEINLPQ